VAARSIFRMRRDCIPQKSCVEAVGQHRYQREETAPSRFLAVHDLKINKTTASAGLWREQ